jgi:hypothetical protein
MRNLLITILIIISIQPVAAAEAVPQTVEQSIPDGVLNAPEDMLVTFVVENDLFGGGTDKNYSSGVRANFTDMHAALPDIAYKIDKLIPMFRINQTTSLHYSLGQNIYTPRDITQSMANLNDRPWAAFLYGSVGMVTLARNHTDEVEATVGVVGPLALGKEAQSFIHAHISGSPAPQGWSHQLKNEPGGMLAWQRAWPMFVNGKIKNNFWSVKPYFGATVGNIRTYAATGFTIRLSPYDSRWQDTPIRVSPAMPGTGIYEIPANKWSWELFSGLEGRAVAHDITLDGNTFANSYSVEKKPFVADATAGFAVTYNKARISYALVYRTKEFVEQDHPEIFGTISLGVRF